jgi:hypothetical protein
VLEEHVDQLPEDVVERFHQLLGHVAVGRRRGELVLGAGRREGDGQAPALASRRGRRRRLPIDVAGAEGHGDVVGPRQQCHLGGQVAALASQSEGGQRALAHDHRVHELDGDVPRV